MQRREFFTRSLSATAAVAAAQLTADRLLGADDSSGSLPGAVLNEQLAGGPPGEMLNRMLMRRVAAAEQRAEAVAAAIDTPEKLQRWQEATRQRFIAALGGFPQRTPTRPRLVETVVTDGYRIEKILFESQPNHFVSGALFLPDPQRFAPPYPVILVPCGHSERPRDRDIYQRPCVIAAMNGMACWLYDPLDQGERMQELDEHGQYQLYGTRGHNNIGVSAQLLGWNAARSMIWDGMRGLDFLCERDDIDAEQIGCMGISGGGTLTSYLIALDSRIKAAAPACYISTLQEVYAAIGPQDAEQNIFGQLAFGMDHAEYLTLFAPRPVRVCATTRDFFPIAGAKQAYARARGVYERLGIPERISFFEDDERHTWSEPLRIASVQWMSRWLRGVDELYVPKLEDVGITPEQMRITEHAQVMRLPDARSIYDLMRDEAARLQGERPELAGEALRAAVRSRAAIRPLESLPVPKPVRHSEQEHAWGKLQTLTLAAVPEMPLPAFFLLPTKATQAPVLWVHDEGKTAAAEAALALAQAGHPVLAVDVSGFGETQGERHRFYGSDAVDEGDAVIAYALGQSLLGIRAEEMLICARWLAAEVGAEAVDLRTAGWAVTPGLHAAVAEPQLVAKFHADQPPLAWEEVVDRGDRHRFSDVIHGGLIDYTLEQLRAAAQRAS